ncbi:UbiD family decarboxylase [Diplocloster agilis]|uniref:UbiD family decarboxylase n=1 Tax=Diplocloster agilis TaxID=2850323 RepID=UPI0008224858|nr:MULTISPECIES: UbiD family decarboxylase [Lachnospiraceae]MBU9746442.1 UbiD family decarboxylase [Diplocloster agilis]MCU6736179.1 UbiD family decarboxylase [Suonthocola fibrivorans]SCJ87351.1 Phenolic acid decarboxylase subunit C [uncultured Clostridium sp.]
MSEIKIRDLRSALDKLRRMENELVETGVQVDPEAELSGVYRYVGAGGTVMRPTKKGPAVIFNNVKGHPDARVAIGVLASRERVAALLDSRPEDLGHLLRDSADHPIEPVLTEEKPACQEVIHYASEEDFDLYKLIPAPTNTPDDAGPYITLGMCYATHPDTGRSDVTIHRLCIQGKDELSIFFTPGARHIGAMAERAEALGQRLPISVSIGVDPAIEIASCFEPPTTPLGFDELSIAGALRGEAVKLTNCLTVKERAIANAEYVIEGEVLPGIRVREDQNRNTGYAMPEFPGYTGAASDQCWIIKVKAVTHRRNPIMQTCIGPSEEHVSMAGIPTEASIIGMIDKAMPGKLKNVYCASAGGGKYMAVLQIKKTVASDEGRQRQAALLAFSAFSELKHIFLVDEDVDCFDMNDVLWAMNTRFQGDVDIITIPGVRCHPLDPSNSPLCTPSCRDQGIACKVIFDCTVPFDQKERFIRSRFMELDPADWIPE